MDLDLNVILNDIKDKKTVSISDIQRTYSIGFNKSYSFFKELIDKEYISSTGEVNTKKVYKTLGLKYHRGVKIIFLDIDGVLNCSTTKDKCGPYTGIEDEKVNILKQIINQTHAKIVLTSSWKEHWHSSESLKYKQDDLANYLDEKLTKQGLKVVTKTKDEGLNRGEGILNYVKRIELKGVKVDKFVIIDDEMFDYKKTKLTKYLVQTSYSSGGLSQKHIDKVLEKLS
jgi:hypothetical protein